MEAVPQSDQISAGINGQRVLEAIDGLCRSGALGVRTGNAPATLDNIKVMPVHR